MVCWQVAGRGRIVDEADAKRQSEAVSRRLAKETGITVEQARFLVTILGTEWSSLLREARLLKGGDLRT